MNFGRRHLVIDLDLADFGIACSTATNWICNFIVVEITPIGIQSLGWQFYIIWTVFNLVFVPTIYFFYPETADRTLEDLDAYYRESPPLLVFRDKDVTSSKRPQKYIEAEKEEIRRASSANPLDFRRESRLSTADRGYSSRRTSHASTLPGGMGAPATVPRAIVEKDSSAQYHDEKV